MAKDICVLDIRDSQGGFVTIRCLFWISVTNGYKTAAATSSYPDANTDPNTSGLQAALQAGTIIEEVYSFLFPVSWVANQWATAIEPLLVAYLNARKAYRSGTQGSLPDPGVKYAILHDSVAGWSA